MRHHRILAVVAAGVGCAAMFRAYTATLVVDPFGGTPYTTIQSAINAAVPGQDDVFVRCGLYREHVTMRDGVSLRGQDPACSVIDGEYSGTVVRVPKITQPTVLEGLTIRNGESSNPSLGPGIDIAAGSPVIRGNVILDNGRVFLGPGIFAHRDVTQPPVVSAPVITRNVISGNHNWGYGGGILMYDTEGGTITSNLIWGNMAEYGGGVYAGCPCTIANNTFVENVAGAYGGGLTGSGIVANNIFVGNRAGVSGGGVWLPGPATTFYGNDAFDNVPNNYTSSSGDPTGSNGNVSVDPLFLDAEGGGPAAFQLRSSSALLEAGTPAWGPSFDLLGVPRPLDGDADGASIVDIGAVENDGPTRLGATSPGTFVWDPVVRQPTAYDAFRGDLATLRATGVYTQDPGTVPGARHFCDLPAPTFVDPDLPEPGGVFFYLVAARGVVPGTLGFDSAAMERPRTFPCTPP